MTLFICLLAALLVGGGLGLFMLVLTAYSLIEQEKHHKTALEKMDRYYKSLLDKMDKDYEDFIKKL